MAEGWGVHAGTTQGAAPAGGGVGWDEEAEETTPLVPPDALADPDAARFAAQYRVWRTGLLGSFNTQPTRMPSCCARPRPGGVSARGLGSARSFSARKAGSFGEDEGRPSPGRRSPSPGGREPGRRRARPLLDRRGRIRDIRSSELDETTWREAQIPWMPQEAPGFLSTAHLRSETYWKELLGIRDAVVGPCQWIVGSRAQRLVVCAIVANAVLLGVNAEDQSAMQRWLQHMIYAFSLFELVVIFVRFRAGVPAKNDEERAIFFIDSIATLGCIYEKWVLPLLGIFDASITARWGPTLAEAVKMLWLARFARVVLIVPSLHELAKGIGDALQGLLWVLIFMLLFVYSLAVLCTRLIGHADIATGADIEDYRDEMEVQLMFKNVGTSMFYLFQIMSQWSLTPLFPLFTYIPPAKGWFVLFYIAAGWTLLAVMTGVVSFNMIALKHTIMEEDSAREEERRMKAHEVLLEIFQKADEDGGGEVDYNEFRGMLECRDLMVLLTQHTNIKVEDLEDLWTFLDDDKSGAVSVEEFMAGFQWLNEPFKPSTLLRLQEKLAQKLRTIRRQLEGFVQMRFDEFVNRATPMLRKLSVVTEQIQVLDSSFSTAIAQLDQRRAEQKATSALHGEGPLVTLAGLERRLGLQIDQALERLERFVPVDD